MEGSLIIGVLILFFSLIYHFWTLPKTLLLISKVQPYEQAGNGARAILVIGDSTGYGTGARTKEESFAGMLGQLYPDYLIRNDSVNGRKIAGAEKALSVVTEHYDLIIFQIAANDLLAGRQVDEVVADMERLVSKALKHANAVLVLTSGNIGAAPRFSGERAERYRSVSIAYTEAMVALVKNWEQVQFVPLYEDPSFDMFVKEPLLYMANDGLHPSSEGYKIWFEKAKPYVRAALTE